MMLFPVAAATDMTFAERLGYSGQMLLNGLGAVFAALAILWGALALFRFVTEKISDKKANKKTAETENAAPAPVTTVAASTASGDEGAVVAAITAAVAAVLAAENGGVTPAFRVVSYRRVGR